MESDPPGLSAKLERADRSDTARRPRPSSARATPCRPLATQQIGPNSYAFTGWSDGGALVHDVFVPADQRDLPSLVHAALGW